MKHIEALSSGTILSAATALLLSMAAGCVAEDGECPEVEKKEDMCVSLCISGALNSSTRADEQPAPSALGDEEGTIAESYININDLYVLAFEIEDGKDVADGESKLKDIIWSPIEAERLEESQISSNGTTVFLTTFLSSEDYTSQTENFSIAVISNTKNWLKDGETFSLEKGKTKLSDLQRELSYTKAIGEVKSSWTPSNAQSDGIPLFGIRRTNLENYSTKINNSSNPYDLGVIYLLRTLAKVEIYTSEKSGLKIESAAVIGGGWNTNLQLIPFTSSLSLDRMEHYSATGNTGQVHLEPNFASFTPTQSGADNSLSLTSTTSTVDGKEVEKFVVYLPEYMLVINETKRNDIIHLKFEGYDKEFNLRIAPHNSETGLPVGNEDSWQIYWKYILRNYLYRFEINGITVDKELSIKWTVCPMENQPEVDIPTFN